MTYEQYRCPQCHLALLADEVDDVRWEYPPGVERNSSGFGGVEVRVRPGAVYCHNPQHPKPIAMRREVVEVS